jgi:hypothetical protein
MRKTDGNESRLSVSSSARVVPITATLLVATHGMSLEELSLLRSELRHIWNQFEQIPEVNFELATVYSDNMVRLTDRTYRSLLSSEEKVSLRNLRIDQELSTPDSTSFKGEVLWRMVRNLIFTTAHRRHSRHLVIYISHDDPLQLLTKSPFEMLLKGGLCSDNALAYDIVNIQFSATKHSRLWFDKQICPNGRVAVSGLEFSSLKPTMINKAVTTILKSVAKVEVVR